MWSVFSLFVLFVTISSAHGFFKPIRTNKFPIPSDSVLSDPLILTPYLEKGKYKKAQKLSKVTPDIGNLTSYSGFFNVNKGCDSNLFFWFFPAQVDKWKTVPLVLWLQGGPGSTSMYGVFEELGPFESYPEGLKRRQFSWNNETNLLIIDQPVGTGYSYTGKGCYPTNETVIGEDLYSAVVQFHQLFPNFQKQRFYIAGESYAGHYIPALGHFIQKNKANAKVKINLTAMMIGDGWVDPIKQVNYADYFYQAGLLDDEGRDIYRAHQDLFVQQVTAGDYVDAFNTVNDFTDDLYAKHVGVEVDIYNYLPQPDTELQNWDEFVQSAEIREALHVGDLDFQSGELVYQTLANDSVMSVKDWVEELLEDYPIIFYFGEVDIICAYPLGINYIRSLNWSGQSTYLNSTRTMWHVGTDLAGYYKGSHNMYDVLVRAAGHMVPTDQPLWAYILMISVVTGSPEDPMHLLRNRDYVNNILKNTNSVN